MDSQERHELKQNELQGFFSNFGQWWRQHGNTVLIVVTIGAVAVLGYTFYTDYQAGQQNAAWEQRASSTSPEALSEVAKTHEVPAVQALARLNAGDLYLRKALKGQPATDEDGNGPLAQAKALYQQVVASQSVDAVYKVNAHLGLAAAAENEHQWQAARNQYGKAIELAKKHNLDALAGQAQARRDRLGQFRQPVRFADAPQTPSQPARPGMGGGTLSPGASQSLQDILQQGGGSDTMPTVTTPPEDGTAPKDGTVPEDDSTPEDGTAPEDADASAGSSSDDADASEPRESDPSP